MLPRALPDAGIIFVKLKRQLKYHGHVNHQTVRPSAVLKGLQCLQQNNVLYKDTQVNESWEQTSVATNAELWDSLIEDSNMVEERPSDEVAEKSDQLEKSDQSQKVSFNTNTTEPDSDSDKEEHPVPGVQFDTCLQRSEGPGLEYNIAPGEGQRPISVFRDDQNEELSFPREFPKGRYGYSCNRNVKISRKKYYNARIFGSDTRFSQSTSYIFNAQYASKAE